MGRILSQASKHPKAIVVLQWENSPQATSPCLQFWVLNHSVDSRAKSFPIPTAVPNRIDELGSGHSETNDRGSQVHLPPLLAYDSPSKSILMHNFAAGENVDVECIRWGPGIHLTQMQAMARLFVGAPAGLSDAKYLSPPGMIRSDVWSEEGDFRAGSGFLTAIAMDGGHGNVNIKYRAKNLRRNSVLPLDINEAYRHHEQTLRTVMNSTTSDTTLAPSMSNTPVYMHSVGRRLRYLLLMTLSQDEDETNTLLSLYTMDQNMAFLDACTMETPNEDRGLRWQVQAFKLPMHVSSIAPVVLDIRGTQYLFVFYFDKGALHYAQMKYAGSGFFEDSIDKIPRIAVPDQKSRTPTHAPGSTLLSRWSLSSRLSIIPQEPDPEPSKEHSCEERVNDSLPPGAEGCHPYVIVANGFIWVFYEGADLNGKYVCHSIPDDVENLSEGWQAISWTSGPPLKEPRGVEGAGISKHFIPVVVPGDFMSMY